MITGCNHVGLSVSNLERSVAFYANAFGFQLRNQFEAVGNTKSGLSNAHLKVALLSLGTLHLELIEYVNPRDDSPRAQESRPIGSPHLAFTTDNIEDDFSRLRMMGVRFLGEPRQSARSGSLGVYGLDPDGIRFELTTFQKEAPR